MIHAESHVRRPLILRLLKIEFEKFRGSITLAGRFCQITPLARGEIISINLAEQNSWTDYSA